MCGFAGLVDPTFAPVDRAAVVRMTETLSARGPDGAGYSFGRGVGLGHRRLKILDLTPAGAQPMTNPAGTLLLVHNGEIYNFADLRAELLAKGHVFQSRSDSEVLLHGYAAWGDEITERAQGMFAFALWDSQRRRLLLARDRMGKKPLYYAAIPRPGAPPLFAFASECKAILQAPGFERRLDPVALGRYLVHEYVPPPQTIFAGARKLDAGASLLLAPGDDPHAAPVLKAAFELPVPTDHPALPLADAAAELWTLLRRAVERRLVADVPVGIFLSGGIDSSAVAAAATDLLGHRGAIDSFAIGFSDPSFDESAHARTVAAHLGTRHHEERLDGQRLLDLLPGVESFLDEPFADPSILPTTLLARFARQHVTVALGGDGGDELFAGYPTFAIDRSAGRLLDYTPTRCTAFAQRLLGALPAQDGYFSLDFKLHQFLRGGSEPGPVRHQRWLGAFVPEELPGLLAPAVVQAMGEPLAPVRAFAEAHRHWHQQDALMAFYARFYLAGDVNVKVDRAAGSCGLEVRAPFLDRDLVSFACLLPPGLRRKGGISKRVLKQALRGRLPSAIIDRRKQGFGVPIARWLKSELRPLLQAELEPELLRRQGIFEPTAVAALVAQHMSGRRDRRKQLWALLMFQRWWRTFGSGSGA